MTVDARITRAITEAVEEAGQPAMLAHRLIAWFEAVTSGNEDINDQTTIYRRLEVLFEGAVVKNNMGEGEG